MQNFQDVDDVPHWPVGQHVAISFDGAERTIDPIAATVFVSQALKDKVWNCSMVMAIDPTIRRIDFAWEATIITGKFYNQPIFKPYCDAIIEWINSDSSEAIADEDAIAGFTEASRFLIFNEIWISVVRSGEHLATSLHCSIGGIFNYSSPPISCLEGPVIWQDKEPKAGHPKVFDDIPFDDEV